ncbi:hypothetical protein BABINDRAFT_113357 [Babjeviella inositovora NRRL Y-12698]|uniref:MARVEL domain-containing protein n=1 Tax=Babjeviella inositovora NRRL Y-12698 TaxID=984486 RepID=A0A1E3QW91_9ASCO|nr:uncharacterized protein BABINDRAFT_113357 [Babjeviella inositovora NRRL Y-12698]ODQ81928.1 hypothetical protein BABINDRAFT_113357 [Babjeviella inositovora NRRL Y-12698]
MNTEDPTMASLNNPSTVIPDNVTYQRPYGAIIIQRTPGNPPSVIPLPSTIFSMRKSHIRENIRLQNGESIETINSIYSCYKVRVLMFCSAAILILEYFVNFMSLPFDDIQNRPVINVIAGCYGIFMFAISACLLPVAASTIPTRESFSAIKISAAVQFLGTVLWFVSFIVTLRVEHMFSYDVFENFESSRSGNRTDVTVYTKVLCGLAFGSNFLAFALFFANMVVIWCGLMNLFNKVDRRKRSDAVGEPDTEAMAKLRSTMYRT